MKVKKIDEARGNPSVSVVAASFSLRPGILAAQAALGRRLKSAATNLITLHRGITGKGLSYGLNPDRFVFILIK